MATPIAQAAINTFFQISDGNSPENFVTVANVGDITGPTFKAAVVDVTSHSTGNPWRQKVVTLLDPGTIAFPCYFIPNDSGHQRLQGIFVNRGLPTLPGVNFDMRLSYPTSPRTIYSLSGYIDQFSMDAKVADVIRANMQITLTGEPSIPGVNA